MTTVMMKRIARTPDTFTQRGIGGGCSFDPEGGESMEVSRRVAIGQLDDARIL